MLLKPEDEVNDGLNYKDPKVNIVALLTNVNRILLYTWTI
jgi:hypothetical protein